MIVYGDPSFRVTAHSLLDEIKHLATSAKQHDLDSCRTLLIKAGQLEQGLADADAPAGTLLTSASEGITDAAARQFIHAFRGQPVCASAVPLRCDDLARAIERVLPLTIKVPEGFAFYTLFPEQYVLSAQEWLTRHSQARSGGVAVIGLRSIGTTLSAVVAETLRLAGCRVTRITVRPYGHPFERTVDIPASALNCSFAIVVDEGPGLSGSSMAAVAEALHPCGISYSQITFLPAHGSEPGHAAPEIARRCWSQVERIVTPLCRLSWKGETLVQSLKARTERTFGSHVLNVHDASGGLWRRFAYPDETSWPTANIPFERVKYLCELDDGRRVIWKFTGFDGTTTRRAPVDGYIKSVRLADFFRGFTAELWLDGPRLERAQGTALGHAVGRYVKAVAAPRLEEQQAIEAIDRLGHILYSNTRECLGIEAADATRWMLEEARRFIPPLALPCYGDGRMAPHEFLRNSDGFIYKTDACGHDRDHTAIGKQCLLWDAAGAIIEWEMREAEQEGLLRSIDAQIPDSVLDFYCAAYAAFRLGMLSMVNQTDERRRAQSEVDRYEFWLSALLHRSTSPLVARAS